MPSVSKVWYRSEVHFKVIGIRKMQAALVSDEVRFIVQSTIIAHSMPMLQSLGALFSETCVNYLMQCEIIV